MQRYRIFFSAEKFMAHSFIQNPEIRFFFFREAGKKKQPNFGRFWHFGVFFFLPPRKSLQATHSLNLEGCFFFFPASEKKKTPFLLTHSNMGKIFQNTNFSRNKKKTVPLALHNKSLMDFKILRSWRLGFFFFQNQSR